MRLMLAMLVLAVFTATAAASPTLVANPRGAFAVWQPYDTTVRVVLDTGEELDYRVREGCRLQAAAPDAAVLQCGAATAGILRLHDAAWTEVALPANTGQIIGAGTHWLDVLSVTAPIAVETLVGRNSGTTIPLQDDPFGKRRVIDLDAVGGARRLCGGARRREDHNYKRGAKFHGAAMVDGRVLVNGRLRDCRTGRVRRTTASTLGPLFALENGAILRLAPFGRQPLPALTGTPVVSRGAVWSQDPYTDAVSRFPL